MRQQLRYSSLKWFRVLPVLLVIGCSKVDLYTALPEKEANEIMAILMENDIACTKQAGEEGAWKLSVEQSRFSESVDILSQLGRPREKFASIGEMFQKTGLVSSPSEERIRFMYALSQELSNTISQIDGVVSARVHIVLPDNNPFGEAVKPSSAAVFVKHQRTADIDSAIVQIKQLVISSIEGLEQDNVSVSLFEAENSILGDRPTRRSETPLTEILSVKVAKESVPRAWAVLSIAAGVTVVGLAFGVAGITRGRRAPRAR